MKLKQIYDIDIFKDVINKLHKEYGDKVYSNTRQSNELQGLIDNTLILCCLCDDDKVVGHISYRKPNEGDYACSIVSVFINEEFRGKGLGKVMMLNFDEHIKSIGLSQIILGARRGKEGFYYSCGYTGEALLQANKDDSTKDELEDILKQNNITYKQYVFRNDEIHQFYFDTKFLQLNQSLYDKVDSSNDKINLVVVFTKKL